MPACIKARTSATSALPSCQFPSDCRPNSCSVGLARSERPQRVMLQHVDVVVWGGPSHIPRQKEQAPRPVRASLLAEKTTSPATCGVCRDGQNAEASVENISRGDDRILGVGASDPKLRRGDCDGG